MKRGDKNMKEIKFYVIFMVYLMMLAIIGIQAFEYVVNTIDSINSYILGITIITPLLILILFLAIIIATKLALITSFKKTEEIKENIIKSFKFVLEGAGIVTVGIPIYIIIANTCWVIQTGQTNLEIIIGEIIIVSSLILIGGICVLSQTYIAAKAFTEKHNKRILNKDTIKN